MADVEHVPVLYRETLDGLALRPDGRYIDCTAGSGGHAVGILEGSAPAGELLALDTDPDAIVRTRAALSRFGDRFTLEQVNFRYLRQAASRRGWTQVDGVLLDLGVSSVQLGTAERGFSFQENGPLDMRMDHTAGISAAEVVNSYAESDLIRLLREYGEEPLAARIAAAIVRERARAPLVTTLQLAELVARVKPRKGRIHPATTVFQALRIAVNGELDSIEQVLPQVLDLIRPGGRLAVIAFHSLEDRLVKRFMQEGARVCTCPPQQPVCTCDRTPLLRLIARHAIQASDEEQARNPRARSARLRVAERL